MNQSVSHKFASVEHIEQSMCKHVHAEPLVLQIAQDEASAVSSDKQRASCQPKKTSTERPFMSTAATEAVYSSPTAVAVANAVRILSMVEKVFVLSLLHQRHTRQRCCLRCQSA